MSPRAVTRPSVAAAALAAALIVVLLGCGGAAAPRGNKGGAEKGGKVEELPTRKEFEVKVLGKSTDELLKMLGKPERTSVILDQDNWTYKNVCRDPVTDKPDRDVTLWLQHGRVQRVSY